MKILTFSLLALLLSITFAYPQNEARLLRFPAIHGNSIVFSYAGNLYLVAKEGGIARQITSHDGYEMFPKFSPDGKQIAFTGQYDGNTEVFTIDADGGTPKRLTYTATLHRDDVSDRMGPNNIVMTWTNDGQNIVYRSRKQTFNDFKGQLFNVSVNGGLSEELPLPSGGFCSYSPDGNKLAFNRVFREFRTWKYYKGGMADDVWIYDFTTKQTENITNNVSQDIFPMWYKNKVFYISERDRIMNLFEYNIETKETKKLTNFDRYDIKFPSINGNQIVFENAGYLYVYEIDNDKLTKVSVQINDDVLTARNEYVDASKFISSLSLSPDANRIAIGARGDVFTVPVKSGLTRNLTQSSGAHDRNVKWSPDGKYIAYISDATGEFEIYIQKQDGSEPAIQLTTGADTYMYWIKWSPDSKKILWNDKKFRLQYVDIDTKAVTLVEKSNIWEFTSFNWSTDSKWIAYAKTESNKMSVIYLYNLISKESTPVTDKWFDSYSPEFSQDGKLLYFVSSRDFHPTYSQIEWNHSYNDMEKIYFLTLAKNTPSPLAPENDEVKLKSVEKEDDADKKDSKKDSKENKDITVDLDGIIQRISDIPVLNGNYGSVTAFADKVYYVRNRTGEKAAIYMYEYSERKETKLGEYHGYEISADNKKMLIRNAKKYYVIDLPKSEIKLKDDIDLSNMNMYVNKQQEWKQIYDESWRQMRDFFYVENMHGVNWKDMYDKYADLLPYVKNRNDLNYVIGELIGELNVGHAYVGDGDRIKPERIKTGLLGAKLSRHSSGYYRIDKILKGQNWERELRSPFTEIGINVNEGDYIVAINGKSTKDMNDIYESLVGYANKQVEIETNSKPDENGATKQIIVPIADESNLYYYNWVQSNIEKVDKATNGQVGYIHVPNMVTEGLNEFAKYFYPQLDKKALIIDDRGNGGGNISPMLIERLMREVTRSNMARNVEVPDQTPRQIHIGPKVLLIDNYSASDGDLFPYAFKKHEIGKVIGVRSWGGVVGIRGSLPFIDGGFLRKPEFASYSADESKWIIEGHGVDPDIVVDNDPAKEYAGEDQQLNKAIEVIMKELEEFKYSLPAIPEAPDKSK